MSEEDAAGLGVHFIRRKIAQSEPKHAASQWSLEGSPNSAEEYGLKAQKIARRLLAENTPEELALIAAQNIILVDELKAGKAAVADCLQARNEQVRLLEGVRLDQEVQLLHERERSKLLLQEVASLLKAAVGARGKGLSKKANDIRHEATRKRTAKAMAEWDASGLKNKSEFARRSAAKYGVTFDVMCRWIRAHEKAKRVQALGE